MTHHDKLLNEGRELKDLGMLDQSPKLFVLIWSLIVSAAEWFERNTFYFTQTVTRSASFLVLRLLALSEQPFPTYSP